MNPEMRAILRGYNRRSADKPPEVPVMPLENQPLLEQAQAHEYAALLVSQQTEKDMRNAILWQEKANTMIENLLAEARRLRALAGGTAEALAKKE